MRILIVAVEYISQLFRVQTVHELPSNRHHTILTSNQGHMTENFIIMSLIVIQAGFHEITKLCDCSRNLLSNCCPSDPDKFPSLDTTQARERRRVLLVSLDGEERIAEAKRASPCSKHSLNRFCNYVSITVVHPKITLECLHRFGSV